MSSAPGSAKLSLGCAKRLIHPAEFARVKAEGRTARGALLVVAVLETGERMGFRAGFVTSKRVGNAVVRNRVRRRLREIVRRNQQRVRRALWMVVVARPAAARAHYRELEDEWLRLANRASILAP